MEDGDGGRIGGIYTFDPKTDPIRVFKHVFATENPYEAIYCFSVMDVSLHPLLKFRQYGGWYPKRMRRASKRLPTASTCRSQICTQTQAARTGNQMNSLTACLDRVLLRSRRCFLWLHQNGLACPNHQIVRRFHDTSDKGIQDSDFPRRGKRKDIPFSRVVCPILSHLLRDDLVFFVEGKVMSIQAFSPEQWFMSFESGHMRSSSAKRGTSSTLSRFLSTKHFFNSPSRSKCSTEGTHHNRHSHPHSHLSLGSLLSCYLVFPHQAIDMSSRERECVILTGQECVCPLHKTAEHVDVVDV